MPQTEKITVKIKKIIIVAGFIVNFMNKYLFLYFPEKMQI